jgi:hypothetical protein
MSRYLGGGHNMKYLVILLVLLVIADGIISQYLTSQALGLEGNPILRTIIGSGDFLPLKAAGALLAALLLWDIYKRRPQVALVSSAMFVALYTGILYWNLFVFFLGRT